MMSRKNRRSFLKTAGAAMAMTQIPLLPEAYAQGNRPRLRITDVRNVSLRMAEEIGSLDPAWSLGSRWTVRIGGGSFMEIHTDQGLVGISNAVSEKYLPIIKEYLVGKDPFDAELHFTNLKTITESTRGFPAVDIALWDLIGKACNQPLYKLWGGGKDRIVPYASMVIVGTPEERADMATQLLAEGWKAIKLRFHAPTFEEDIRQAEAVRKAVGDKMAIMVDANQDHRVRMGIEWDLDRALKTARALEPLDFFFLEDALNRSDLEGNAELTRQSNVPIAGAENNRTFEEYRENLRRDVYDFYNPEVNTLGVYGYRKVDAMVHIFDKRIVPHNGAMTFGLVAHMHLVAASGVTPYVEVLHDPPIGSYLHHFAIFSNHPTVDKDGLITMPQTPGLGIEMNPDLVEKG